MTAVIHIPGTIRSTAGRKSFELIPADQIGIVTRIALAGSAMAGQGAAFVESRLAAEDPQRDVAEGDFYRQAMSDAYEMLVTANLADVLGLVAGVMVPPAAEVTPCGTVEEAESYIAGRMVEMIRIERQIDQWKAGLSPERDEAWAAQAQRALNRKTENIGFAHKIRLRRLRADEFREILEAKDRHIALLQEQNRRDKEKRLVQISSNDAGFRAARDFVREHAPHLFVGMMDEVRRAQEQCSEMARSAPAAIAAQ